MPRSATFLLLLGILALPLGIGCRGGGDDAEDRTDPEEAQVDADLGSLRVLNRATEPVAIHLDGQELYTVPSGREYTFHNLPTREVDVYGVGRVSQRHYDLPRLTIEGGGEYEWTINP